MQAARLRQWFWWGYVAARGFGGDLPEACLRDVLLSILSLDASSLIGVLPFPRVLKLEDFIGPGPPAGYQISGKQL